MYIQSTYIRVCSYVCTHTHTPIHTHTHTHMYTHTHTHTHTHRSLMPLDEREEDIMSRLSIHHPHQPAESAVLPQSRLARQNLSLLSRPLNYHLSWDKDTHTHTHTHTHTRTHLSHPLNYHLLWETHIHVVYKAGGWGSVYTFCKPLRLLLATLYLKFFSKPLRLLRAGAVLVC